MNYHKKFKFIRNISIRTIIFNVRSVLKKHFKFYGTFYIGTQLYIAYN